MGSQLSKRIELVAGNLEWLGTLRLPLYPLLKVESLSYFFRQLPGAYSVEVSYLGPKNLVGEDYVGEELVGKLCFIREVTLYSDQIPLVRARSCCSPSSLYWTQILNCGSQPLGDLIFKSPGLSRGPLEYYRVSRKHDLLANSEVQADCVARQSYFWHEQRDSLLLTECFLPSIQKVL